MTTPRSEKPLRVLLVSTFYSAAGGTESYLFAIARALHESGVEIGVLYQTQTGREPQGEPWSVFHAPALDPTCGLAITVRQARIEEVVTRFGPDVIHVNLFADGALLGWLCTLRPVVHFMHSQYPLSCPGDSKFLKDSREVCTRRVGRFCMIAPWIQGCGSRRPWVHLRTYASARDYREHARGVRQMLVASNYMRDELLLNGFPAERVTVVRLPNTAEHAAEKESVKGVPDRDTRPIVLYVGRITLHKGVDLLVKALEHVSTPCRLILAGDGVYRRETEVEAARAPVRHTITFAGWQERAGLDALYRRARVVVVPSAWAEPFGLVGLEAMSYEKPVVAFDRGGIGEWLADGINGILVRPNDLYGLGRSIETVLSDDALAERMGKAGHALLVEKFSIDSHLELLMGAYRAAIG